MKFYIVFLLSILLFINFLSCKSQKQNYIIEDMLAYQPKNEKELIYSVLSSENYKEFRSLRINNKKYPMDDFQKIMDTLEIENYNVSIKSDTKTNKKTLVIKSL